MKKIKFTYSVDEVTKRLAAHYSVKSLRFVRLIEKDDTGESHGVVVKHNGEEREIDNGTICVAFGGVGNLYDHKGFHPPMVKWTGKGKSAKCHVWKKLLTIDEFREVMRRHNKGFGDKFNPKVLRGVVVYSPSASGWKRHLWDCDFKDRAYYCYSTAETYREVDPSAGMCRHPHCSLTSLRGDCMHGGESLLRPDYSWVVDYCYIDGFVKGGK